MGSKEPGVRQLDNAIIVVLLSMLIGLLGIAVVQISNSDWHLSDLLPELNPNLSMDGNTMGYFLWIPILGGIFWYFWARAKKKEELEKSPEQPFKVNVAVAPIKDNAVLGYMRGRKLTHQLEMDIKISPKDWRRIEETGLMDAPLFEYPNEIDTSDPEPQRFPVKYLQGGPKYILFYNIHQAEEAKEKLLKNLYNLKDAIEVQKEGRRAESYEI